MNAITIVVNKLKATSAVTSKVPQIFPIDWPQGAQPPVIVVNLVGDSEHQLLDGGSGYYESRVRVETMGAVATETSTANDAVRDALRSLVKATVGAAVDVDIAYLTGTSDKSDDRSTYRFISDFSVRWRQP